MSNNGPRLSTAATYINHRRTTPSAQPVGQAPAHGHDGLWASAPKPPLQLSGCLLQGSSRSYHSCCNQGMHIHMPLSPSSALDRSRHTSQPSSSNKDAAAAAKEHRPISFLEWQKKTHPGDDKEAPVKGDTARSSRHQAQSPRRREPSGSRRQDSAPSQEDRRRHDPHPREPRGSPRHRALTPERQRPASRPRIDERRVMVVPKFVDVNHGLDRSEMQQADLMLTPCCALLLNVVLHGMCSSCFVCMSTFESALFCSNTTFYLR